MKSTLFASLVPILISTGFGCASSQATSTPADPPVASATDSQRLAATETPPAHAAEPAEEPEAEPTETSEPEPGKAEPFRLVRTPKDIVTAADTSFVSNLTVSAAYEQIEERCEQQSGGNMKAQSDCLRTAREKYGTKVVRFFEKRGSWWWVTYERRGNQLVTLHKIPFLFGEETENSLTLLPSGKDEGLAPLGSVPRKVTVTVPNEYSIELKDPIYGSIVYEAKIGITEG